MQRFAKKAGWFLKVKTQWLKYTNNFENKSSFQTKIAANNMSHMEFQLANMLQLEAVLESA